MTSNVTSLTTDMREQAEDLLTWDMFRWLRRQGIPPETLVRMTSLRIMRGQRAPDGWLNPDGKGAPFVAFYEDMADDVVFWSPRTDELATWAGRAFALGEDNIFNAGTYAFDKHLYIHPTALAWLRDQARGIVVLDWERAFDMLRDAPRVAVAEELLPLYRRHMRPVRMPELAVLASDTRVAA